MYKNQLQELAQRSCFNLPSYTCIREGPDHAPRFKATVNFNGEVFESPSFCTTLRQAEHSAAEVALNSLSTRAPSHSLAARILDETGVYKNLLQEVAQRVGAPLPTYTTFRSGLGHLPVFTGTVELAGITFTGEPGKNKKQAEKNAALAAWSSLKKLAQQGASSSTEPDNNDEQEQVTIARALLNYRLKEKMAMANNPHAPLFPKKFPIQPEKRPSSMQCPPSTGSKILPFIRPNSASRARLTSPAASSGYLPSSYLQSENWETHQQNFPAAGAAPYVPLRNYRPSYHGMAPPVTIRTAVPVFSAPPLPPPSSHQRPPMMCSPRHVAPPVRIRSAVPVFAAPSPQVPAIPVLVKEPPNPIQVKETPTPVQVKEHPIPVQVDETTSAVKVKENPIPVRVEETPKVKENPIPVRVDETPSPFQVKEGFPVPVQAKETNVPVQTRETPGPVQMKEPLQRPPPLPELPGQMEEVTDASMSSLQESSAVESLTKLEI